MYAPLWGHEPQGLNPNITWFRVPLSLAQFTFWTCPSPAGSPDSLNSSAVHVWFCRCSSSAWDDTLPLCFYWTTHPYPEYSPPWWNSVKWFYSFEHFIWQWAGRVVPCLWIPLPTVYSPPSMGSHQVWGNRIRVSQCPVQERPRRRLAVLVTITFRHICSVSFPTITMGINLLWRTATRGICRMPLAHFVHTVSAHRTTYCVHSTK